jgi:hypothetical protein
MLWTTAAGTRTLRVSLRYIHTMRLVRIFSLIVPILQAQQATPSVDDILDRYVLALGGKSEFERVTSLVMKGAIEFPDLHLSGTTTEYFKSPKRLAVIVEIGGIGTVRTICDGTEAWTENPQTGVQPMTGAELSDLLRRADLQWHLKLKEYYPGLRIKDRETIIGQDVWVLEATVDGVTHRWYLNVGNGELIRFDTDAAEPENSSSILISDYRPAGNVRFPYAASFTGPKLKWNRKLSEVQINVPVDDALFAKPAAKKPAAAGPAQ